MTDLTQITQPLCFLTEETRKALKAHKKSGGKVQVLLLTGEWVVASKTFWNPGRVYRAKPEPLELWVNEYPGHVCYSHPSEEEADYHAGFGRLRCFRVIEAPEQGEG